MQIKFSISIFINLEEWNVDAFKRQANIFPYDKLLKMFIKLLLKMLCVYCGPQKLTTKKKSHNSIKNSLQNKTENW